MAGPATTAEVVRALSRIQDTIETNGSGSSLCRLEASWIGAAVDILIGQVQREREAQKAERDACAAVAERFKRSPAAKQIATNIRKRG